MASSGNVFESNLIGFERDLALVHWCSFPQILKVEIKTFITWAEIRLWEHDLEYLF